jgi:hypothetical protein
VVDISSPSHGSPTSQSAQKQVPDFGHVFWAQHADEPLPDVDATLQPTLSGFFSPAMRHKQLVLVSEMHCT